MPACRAVSPRDSRWGGSGMRRPPTRWALLLLVWVALPVLSWGQLELSFMPPHERQVLLEPVEVKLTIANKGGRDVVLQPNHLGCRIVQEPAGLLINQEKPLLKEALTIPARDSVKLKLNLLDHYELQHVGSYTLKIWAQSGERIFNTQRTFFDVLNGSEMASVLTSPPGSPDAVRHFSLISMTREGNDRIFLRIDRKGEGSTYGVFEIGTIIRVEQPLMKVDPVGRVHLLHLEQPRQYVYNIFDPSGSHMERQVIYGPTGSVRMIEDAQGRYQVVGGTRRSVDALRRMGPIRSRTEGRP